MSIVKNRRDPLVYERTVHERAVCWKQQSMSFGEID